MRTMFSPFRSPPRSPLRSPPASPSNYKFSDRLMEENIETAEMLISKWDEPDLTTSSPHSDSLLSDQNRLEARQYIAAVKDLHSSMKYFLSDNPRSKNLIQAKALMQLAMKRLEREFYLILKHNREYLDPESVSVVSSRYSRRGSSASEGDGQDDEDEFQFYRGEDSSLLEEDSVSLVAMNDLKMIAECMITSGYGKECVKIYKIVRKSIVDENLYYLGVDQRLNLAQLQKLEWDSVEIKIKNWLNAIKVAVNTLFEGERVLVDHVFSASPTIKEFTFADITRDSAMSLFGFPEMVAKSRRFLSPEKMFRALDLYEAINDLWPQIESIFDFESTSVIRAQAVASIVKLGEAVRFMLADFEAAISKDNSKTAVPGGAVHPLTRYVMNYLTFLTDYTDVLTDIVVDWPLNVPLPLPETYFNGSIGGQESPAYESEALLSTIATRLAWLVLVLLCKLDGKAELYKDVALSYLFLSNNLNYVVKKVRDSNLKPLLGEDWIAKHEKKAKQYSLNYERMGWSKVFAALDDATLASASAEGMPVEAARDWFRRFNATFEEAHLRQSGYIVVDGKLRDEIKISLARRITPAYHMIYERYRDGVVRGGGGIHHPIVRYAPDDIGNCLSDLFYGTGPQGSVSSSSPSVSSGSSHSRGWRNN